MLEFQICTLLNMLDQKWGSPMGFTTPSVFEATSQLLSDILLLATWDIGPSLSDWIIHWGLDDAIGQKTTPSGSAQQLAWIIEKSIEALTWKFQFLEFLLSVVYLLVSLSVIRPR